MYACYLNYSICIFFLIIFSNVTLERKKRPFDNQDSRDKASSSVIALMVTCTNCINVFWKRRRGTSDWKNEHISKVLLLKNLLIERTKIKETFYPAVIICGVNNASTWKIVIGVDRNTRPPMVCICNNPHIIYMHLNTCLFLYLLQ